jgi:rhomboid-like protein
MTAFVAVVCLLSYGFGHYYIPPSSEYRMFPELSLTTATVGAMLVTNFVICGMWRITPFWPLMTKYFMHVPAYPRAAQSILNVFSHMHYEHLFSNMMFFVLAGTACHNLVDRGIFVGTYVSAGAVGTLASLYWANLGRGSITAHSVGASAAIWGISTLYLLLTDQENIKIPFVKDAEVSFWPKTLLGAFVLMEIHNARKRKVSSMDHASHFGGMFVGASVAGYLHTTGFHQRRLAPVSKAVEDKTLDVGAMVQGEAREITEGVKKVIGK